MAEPTRVSGYIIYPELYGVEMRLHSYARTRRIRLSTFKPDLHAADQAKIKIGGEVELIADPFVGIVFCLFK
jgi:hypothetical protein